MTRTDTVVSEERLREIGQEMATAFDKAVKDYRDLIKLIRKDDMPRAQVGRALVSGCGFSEAWVSQVFRVAKSPEDIFQKYMAGAVGFRAALQEAREKPPELTSGQKKRKLKEKLLGIAHRVGKLAVEQDTDFVLILPEISDDLLKNREYKATVGAYDIHVIKKG